MGVRHFNYEDRLTDEVTDKKRKDSGLNRTHREKLNIVTFLSNHCAVVKLDSLLLPTLPRQSTKQCWAEACCFLQLVQFTFWPWLLRYSKLKHVLIIKPISKVFLLSSSSTQQFIISLQFYLTLIIGHLDCKADNTNFMSNYLWLVCVKHHSV